MSVSWGRRQRYKFSNGGSLNIWVPPAFPAVYAITYKQDANNRPKSHTVLFFGEASDLSQEAPALNRRVLETWADTGGDPEELFVFVLPMHGSTRGERLRVHQELVGDYRPAAND